MDIYELHKLLPIEILIWKLKFQDNHIIFKSSGEGFITNEVKKVMRDNNLTWSSFRPLIMEDFEI